MRFLIVVVFIFSIKNAYPQQVKIVFAKYATVENRGLLKQDDTLSVHNKVTIKEGGELHAINKTGWGFYLSSGVYDLDSCYQVYKEKYSDYDSVKVIIDTIFPNGLDGRFRSVCKTMYTGNAQDLNYQYGNIALLNTDNNDVIKASKDTLTIYWKDPQEKNGRYIIEFEDLYDDVIGYRVTTGNNLHIKIKDFSKVTADLSFLLITIYSEDGRKSSKVAIQQKTNP